VPHDPRELNGPAAVGYSSEDRRVNHSREVALTGPFQGISATGETPEAFA
jgi:hypothetical protein